MNNAMEQRGRFQRPGPLARALVWPGDYWQPRPRLMLTSLFKGAQCGLRQNPLGKKNFKMIFFKAQSMPFSSYPEPQSKSTVRTIKIHI